MTQTAPTTAGGQGFIESRGPSARHIREAEQRFLTVTQARLERLNQGLQPKQQQALSLIPFLFHTHYDGLPGFQKNDAMPTGIAQYFPDAALLRLAQTVFRQKIPQRMPLTQPKLYALYLMGSSGTIGQSSSSDLDIWVCYSPDLNAREIRDLTAKAEAISQWAAGFNLEVHFFLMNSRHFSGSAQQSLTGENCGSTQHVLLLDEFYRTAQPLAGPIPAWWLVPNHNESDYQATWHALQEATSGLQYTPDFGAIDRIDAGEFIGAGMWQLYKAIDAPYKSVLKLLVLEMYAHDYPKVCSLAHRFKQEVYQMHLSLDDLDPYVMLYRAIEQYLTERNEPQRLELIRRCFYFKVGLSLSKPVRQKHWRREYMEYLVSDWGWSAYTLHHLDHFRTWSVDDVLNERRLIINELTHSYRFLTEFAQQHHSRHRMSQRDLVILSRKLNASFDRRPGKIDRISLGLDIDLSHEKIRLYERESKQEPGTYLWAAYHQSPEEVPTASPLKYSRSLLETLLWLHLNGLISAHLQIPVYPVRQPISEFELRMILSTLRQLIPSNSKKIPSDAFHQPAKVNQAVLFINVGDDPLKSLTARGLQKISERSNSLDYSGLRENLVASIDMVLLNSWGEVTVDRFTGHLAVADCLQTLLNRLSRSGQTELPNLETVCHNQTRPQAIATRVKELFADALDALENPLKGDRRFVFRLSDDRILLQCQDKQWQYQQIDSDALWQQQLEQPLRQFSPLRFDRLLTAESPIVSTLFAQHQANTLTIAVESRSGRCRYYLIDERGAMLQFDEPTPAPELVFTPLLRFLKVVEHRQRRNSDLNSQAQRKFQCFQVVRNKDGLKLQSKRPKGLVSSGRFIGIQVNVDATSQGRYQYHVVCNEREFHSAVLGDDLYQAVASFVLGLRASGERYPIYITDLALTHAVIQRLPLGEDTTLDYLKLKRRLEQRINQNLIDP